MSSWRFSNFYFFYFTTIGIIVPYWSLYLQYLGFSATEIGELIAILTLTRVFAPYIWATIADQISLIKGNSFGLLKFASGASFLIFCLMFVIDSKVNDQFWTVAVITFAYSVFWNSCMPQIEAATLNHLAEHRFKYGAIRLWGSVGFIVTVLGLGYLMDAFGPNIILPAAALSFLIMFLASFLLSSKEPAKNSGDSSFMPLRSLLNRKVVIILVLCTLMQASHAPFYTFFSIYLEDHGYSKALIGWLWTTGVVFEIIVFMIGYRLLRQYRLTSLLSFTFLVAAVRWCVLAIFPENVFIVFASQILHAITYGLYHSVMIQLVDQFFQGRYQIRGQALYSSVSFGIGGAIGSAVSGVVWTMYGAKVLFIGAGVLMFIATVLSILLVQRQEEQIPIRSM